MPVCVEASILGLERIYINGGKRGFLVEVALADLEYGAAATRGMCCNRGLATAWMGLVGWCR